MVIIKGCWRVLQDIQGSFLQSVVLWIVSDKEKESCNPLSGFETVMSTW